MDTPADLPLGFALVEVTRLLRREIDRGLEGAGLGITAGEARALAYVGQFGGLRQGELAERMGVEPMTLVNYLDRLEARGLVRRAPHARDRRAKTVSVTAAASPVLDRVHEVARRARDGATEGLSAAEIEALRTALAVMRTNLLPAGVPA